MQAGRHDRRLLPLARRAPGRRGPARALPVALVIIALLVAACGSSTPTPAPPSAELNVGPTASAAAVASSSVESPVAPRCAPAAAASPPTGSTAAWANRIFYEVFVRSFQDSNGDGIGDLRGLTRRLDYLNDGNPATTSDLGVTALWLMPVDQATSYHGYDVVDYRTIERDYGTNADFRTLVAEAHKRGIDVVVDFVINHTSVDNPWFRDAVTPGSKHDSWYVWSKTIPFARPDGNPAWFPAGKRFYYAYFSQGMPDLNLRNPAVTAEIDDISRFWLDDMGVDGFRIDAAKYLIEDGRKLENTPETFAWLAAFRQRVHADRPNALVLGEDWDPTINSSKYVSQGSLDMDFEFDFADAILGSLRSHNQGSYLAAEAEIQSDYPPGGYATFLSNHDQNRVMTQVGGNVSAAKLAATLLFTSPGVPFVYYGEEIGMTGSKPDERIRTPMRWDATNPAAGFSTTKPWEPLSDDPATVSVASETGDPASILSHYRSLVALRDAHPALVSGAWTQVSTTDPSILAYLRSDSTESLLVVANLGESPATSPTLSLASGPLCGPVSATRVFGVGDVTAPATTPAGGFTAYVPITSLAPDDAVVISLAP